MKKKLIALAAAAVLPLALPLAANAAPSPQAAALCEGAETCTVNTSTSARMGVEEGEAVTVQVEGAPNATVAFSIFHVAVDGGEPVSMEPVFEPVSVTLDADGNGTVEIPTQPLTAPLTGGAGDYPKYVVAPADTTDPAEIVTSGAGELPTLQIRSHRAGVSEVDTDTNESLDNITLDGGIAGDQYQVQLEVDGEWVNHTANVDGHATIGELGSAPLTFQVPDSFPGGDYPRRVINIGNDEVVYEDTFTWANEDAPEPTADPTQEPTADPTQEPTAEPTQEPTADPTQEPTAEPTPEVDLTAVHGFGIDGDCAFEFVETFEIGETYTFTACNMAGEPLPGASVDIYTTADGELANLHMGTLVETVTTDDAGTFELTVPESGYIGAVAGAGRFIIGEDPTNNTEGGDQGDADQGGDKGGDQGGTDNGADTPDGGTRPGKGLPKTGA